MIARNFAPERLERKEALNRINKILCKYAPECTAEIFDDALKIRASWKVRKRTDRLSVCSLLVASGLTKRTAKNLSAEWFLHNAAYRLHVRKSSSKDVDLDYTRDRHWPVRFCTKVLELLHLY